MRQTSVKIRFAVLILLTISISPIFAQLQIKKNSDQTVMRVISTGKMAIGQNLTADPVQTLELRNGTLQIVETSAMDGCSWAMLRGWRPGLPVAVM